MPSDNPLVGEIWTMRDPEGRTVRGVIAGLDMAASSGDITLVSVLGRRHRISLPSFRLNWSFVEPAHQTAYTCDRRGCGANAVFRYTRGTHPEHACARHMPTGTLGQILPEQPNAPRTPRTIVAPPINCPSCNQPELIEILPPIPSVPNATSWTCAVCSARWVFLRASVEEPHAWWAEQITSLRRHIQREGNEFSHVHLSRFLFSQFQGQGNGDPAERWSFLWGPAEVRTQTSDENLVFTILFRVRVNSTIISSAEFPRVVQDMLNSETIRKVSQWVHKTQGQVVDILNVQDGVVTFQPDGQRPIRMTETDFIFFHRPFAPDPQSLPVGVPLPELSPDEEWTSADGDIRIVSVNPKRETVVAMWTHGRQVQATLNLRDFATSRWRKVVRRTCYEMILDDEDE